MNTLTQADLQKMMFELRKRGHTEQTIAIIADVSQSTISRLMSGKVKKIRYDIVMKIESFLTTNSM